MASSYPTTLDTLATNKTDGTATAGDHATHHDDLADAVNKVETELGTDPAGSFTNVAARLNARLTCRKTADTTNATTTLANITDLTLPVNTTGIDYWFRFFVPWSSGTAGATAQFAVVVPTVAGYVYYWTDSMAGTAAVPGGSSLNTALPVSYGSHNASANPTTATGGNAASPPAANTIYAFRVEGVLSNPSATGSIQLQGRAEIAATITFKRGAWGEVYVA